MRAIRRAAAPPPLLPILPPAPPATALPHLPHLLFLVHRLPYPPNKGDKIRSHHILQYLQRHFQVHLACFVDDVADRPYVAQLEAHCASSCFIALAPSVARLHGLLGLLTGEAMSLPYYRNRTMQRWVDALLAGGQVHHALVFSGPMAQYLPAAAKPGNGALLRVIDFVDVDSEKWRAYAATKAWPLALLYRREARCLLAHERRASQASDHVSFVSQSEAALFLRRAPEALARTGYFNNGVDSSYFSPAHALASPYAAAGPVLVFTGAMDYWPNIDAVQWFAAAVWPGVRRAVPDACFAIVGARPSSAVRRLASQPGILVSGSVADMRPYLAHAALAVAPLRLARGVQNKVLEAMAMQKIVIVSPQALEGLSATPGVELLVAADGPAFVRHILAVLAGQAHAGMALAARRRVVRDYQWDANLARLGNMLGLADASADGGPDRPGAPADAQHAVALADAVAPVDRVAPADHMAPADTARRAAPNAAGAMS